MSEEETPVTDEKQETEQETTPEETEPEEPEDTGYVTCPVCRATVKSQGRFFHFTNNHPALEYEDYKDQFTVAPSPQGITPEPTEPTPPPYVEANRLVVKEILSKLSSKVYGVSDKKAQYIADTLKNTPEIALNPTALTWHIKQIAGKADNYQLMLFIRGLMNKLREEGVVGGQQSATNMFMPMPQTQQPGQTPFFPPSTTQNQQQQGIFNPFVNPFQPQQPQAQQKPQFDEEGELRKRRLRKQIEREEEEHEVKMAKLKAEIQRLTQPVEKNDKDTITITEPVRDSQGKIVRDEQGNPLYRRIQGSADKLQGRQKGKDESLLDTLMKMKEIGLIGGGISKVDLQEVLQQSQQKEPLTAEKVQKITAETTNELLNRIEKEEKEERRHRELLQAVRENQGKTVEGYKQDEYRLMGQGMNQLADVMKGKHPVKLVVDMVNRVPASGPKTVEKGAREGIFDQVNPKYVTEA